MARHPKFDILFEPVRLGPKTMKNRFYQTPHCNGYGSDFPMAQAAFRGMKAEGGWAAVNTEASSIHPEHDQRPWMTSIFWDDRDLANWARMCDAVHEHEALAGIELHYSGQLASGYETRLPGRHVSNIRGESYLGASYEMTKGEIRELQGFYVAAAKRARSAGFDIVNVHGAEVGGIPVMFLMNYYNKRTDEYGGSLENRARFWMETLELVREAVGDDCAITARFCIDTLHGTDQGIRAEEEGCGFVELADHLVDFWDVQVGGRTAEEWAEDAGPSRFFAQNSQARWVKIIRPYTRKPIAGVGRFTSPDMMVEVIKSGQLDIIGAARPSIADPFLPKKIEEGRLDDIRECIGCNMCVARWNLGSQIVCTQNATSGEEYRRGWHPEKFSRAANHDSDVLVVGAGPAGLECAMVLGKRGMRRIHLLDAGRDIGGALSWISELPGLSEWRRVIDYRRSQLAKLRNVTVITGTELSTQEVAEYGAEYIVIATGARWSMDGLNPHSQAVIPGVDAGLNTVLTPEQIMAEQKVVPGTQVVLYDGDGNFVGVSVAEHLARAGHAVTLITPYDVPAPYMAYTGEKGRMLPLLRSLGVQTVVRHMVTGLEDGVVRGYCLDAEDEGLEWPADAFVAVTQRVSQDSMYRELEAKGEELEVAGVRGIFRIGSCLAPRAMSESIFDGHRLAMEIDQPHPELHVAFERETRFLGTMLTNQGAAVR